MREFIQVITTVDTRSRADEIGRRLVERHLAACVQVTGPVASTYRWNDAIETAEEWYCVVKTARDRYAEVEGEIISMHPYEVAEILALPVIQGSEAYLTWLDSAVPRGK